MIENKRVLVVGKGITGQSVFEKTIELGGKADYYDESSVLSKNMYDIAVISPGIGRKTKTYIDIKGSGIPIYSEADFAYMLNPFKCISVSGTNGKTTVVNLVYGMLDSAKVSVSMVGNMGIPFTKRKKSDWYVAEMSSFMLEQSKFFRSVFSSLTNVTIDHLEYHTTTEKYRKAKLKLFNYTENGVSYDREYIEKKDIPDNLQTIRYSLNDSTADIFIQDGKIKYKEKNREFIVVDVNKINLFGNHNLENIMNALGLCILSNGYSEDYSKFITDYKGEPYRIAYRGLIKGKKTYNDSKGTNVASVISAYKCMQGSTALILGGFDKKESFKPLFRILKKDDAAFISGDNKDVISKNAGQCNVRHYNVCTLEEAIVKAFSSNADNVLFSPGCSSFDRFNSFEERGRFFDEFIEKIKK